MQATRRAFLTGHAAEAVDAAAPSRADVLAKIGAALPATDATFLLQSRTSFGVRQDQLARGRAVGTAAWLEEQLAPETLSDGGLEAALAAALPSLTYTLPQLITYTNPPNPRYRAAAETISATYVRQLLSQRQLYEVMVEFWTNHFNIDLGDAALAYYKPWDDREVVRKLALGNFRDLLQASARSPAMLYYLDNFANVASGPNENYARELMELHTLGINGGYTEADVKDVARCFTGWTIPRQNEGSLTGFVFRGQFHDNGSKRVLGVDIAAGGGEQDGVRVLDILAAHPSTARLIATKLVRRFVSDAPPPTLVDALAAEFTRTQGDIKSILRVLFRSAEFASSSDQKFKRPAEFIVSALRAVRSNSSATVLRGISAQLEAMSQTIFGWPAPNGYPDVRGYWLNTGATLARWNAATLIAEQGFAPGSGVSLATLIAPARTVRAAL
ncbi:MAG: DUF1800 domain-containing protein, partial [Lysobacterales bacterium]